MGRPGVCRSQSGRHHVTAGPAALDAEVTTEVAGDVDGDALPFGDVPYLGADEWAPTESRQRKASRCTNRRDIGYNDSERPVVDNYPRYLEEGFQPHDPLELMQRTEEVACRGEARKYTSFYSTGVYGGIATGYAVGCCLRCVFCWVDISRDFPETHGEFYTPEQVTGRLLGIARRKRVPRLRISGGEPALCKRHLLAVLERIEPTGYGFILETNGIPIAADEDYAADLARYACAHIRVSLKAGTAQGFEARTGARGEFWELPFVAVERLLAAEANFHVAAMTDPRLMPGAERRALLARLRRAGYTGWLEEEQCDAYRSTVKRLRAAGWDLF